MSTRKDKTDEILAILQEKKGHAKFGERARGIDCECQARPIVRRVRVGLPLPFRLKK